LNVWVGIREAISLGKCRFIHGKQPGESRSCEKKRGLALEQRLESGNVALGTRATLPQALPSQAAFPVIHTPLRASRPRSQEMLIFSVINAENQRESIQREGTGKNVQPLNNASD
jgi:hypothetical protein